MWILITRAGYRRDEAHRPKGIYNMSYPTVDTNHGAERYDKTQRKLEVSFRQLDDEDSARSEKRLAMSLGCSPLHLTRVG